MARSSQVAARERARAAKARLDAERAERDKLVEEAATEFYAAEGLMEDLEQQLEEARGSKAGAVVALGQLGEPVDRIAALCGISATEVRALKKAGAKKAQAGSAEQSASVQEGVVTS